MTRQKNDALPGDGIARRDFIGGVTGAGLIALAARPASAHAMADAPAGATPAAAVPDPATYPPVRSGLRGQHPGSFEAAHAARDGAFTGPVEATPTGEHYDLVIVGGGISGLSAAHFYRAALGQDRKILILDNHDDFGGHAKRNEFHADGRTILSYGGTMSIETPFPYSYTAKALLAELGIQPSSYDQYDRSKTTYAGLSRGIYFDKATFGRDKIVPGYRSRPAATFFAEAPLSEKVRADLIRVHEAKVDYLPDLSPDAKAQALKAMSYQDFLLNHVKMSRDALPFFLGQGYRNNMRVDTCPAFMAFRANAPGFQGMEIAHQIEAEAEHFHWPDGNASVARLLVAKLVPGVFPGPQTQTSIVLAPADYGKLDDPANPTRIRLSSIVVRTEHIGKTEQTTEKAVRVVYSRDGKNQEVTAANVILACFNNIIPFIAPEIPQAQKTALAYPSKVPLLYTNVLIRNWQAWKKLGIYMLSAPNGYHQWATLDIPMSIGGYESAATPDQAVVIHMVRNPNQPGLPRKEQNRLGRWDILNTPFETIEAEIRGQLDAMLGAGGFQSKRDILAITVNRWPHGYAYTYDTLGDPAVPDAQRPHVIGRQPFGRIAIANADSGASAFTNVAIDQAHRAVNECLISRGLT
jgi:spermidine dehydrogenase